MSEREMWKALHLLNNTKRRGLTTEELFSAGVDCYPDTLVELQTRGALASSVQGKSERWELTPGARAVLNACSVGMKYDHAAEVQVDRARMFCIMPFSEPWSHLVWKSCITAAAREAGLTPIRGDTTLQTGALIKNVWNEILKCGCVVAELSAPNPNVYYEAGMARALGRDVLVVVQKGTKLPADLKGDLYVEYDLGKLATATRKLKTQFKAWRDAKHIKVRRVEGLFK